MTEGRVLKFEQPANFYYNNALKYIENGDYINALPQLRKAREMEPENQEYTLALAQALTEIGRFDDSNSLLFSLMDSEYFSGECYFGIGCNFMGLNDYERAQQSFERYLDKEPDGDFAEEIGDFLEFIYDMEDEEDVYLEDVKLKHGFEMAAEGKKYLDMGDYKKAAEIFSGIDLERKELLFAKNNLALAYYCLKNTSGAIRTALEVLEKDKENIHAWCNLALFYTEVGDYYNATKAIGKILELNTDNTDELYKIAITLCDLNQHEYALKYLEKILERRTCDVKSMYFAAIACFNLGKYQKAADYISDILKIEPDNILAKYYSGYMKDVLRSQRSPEKLDYRMTLPDGENEKRRAYMQQILENTSDEFIDFLWESDDYFKEMVCWALEYASYSMRKQICVKLSRTKKKSVEMFFRDYILKARNSEGVKNMMLIYLKKMGAPEPYVANMGGSVVEVRVGLTKNDDKKDETEE